MGKAEATMTPNGFAVMALERDSKSEGNSIEATSSITRKITPK